MKEVIKTGSALLRSLLVLLVSVPMLNSCFDDSELWEAIDQLEMRVDSLENGLNAQIEAMSALMTENLMIKDCVMNTDSSYVVTLSNGMTFTVLPGKASVRTLVSCVVVNGVKCWATYDAVGVLTPLLDAKGAPIPVDTAVDVQIKDGKYYLVINGKEYMTGFDSEDVVQVFTSCEAHKDASGQVYAMTFDFGNGLEVTVSVDGYKGVLFKFSNGGTETVVTDYYVNYSEEVSLLMDMEGVVDYVMQIPDGWRIKERYNSYDGKTYVDIKAPAKSLVESGAAVSEGDLKVVSVVDGGKAVVTRLALSTVPFKTFKVSAVKALLEPYFGVQQYVYGLCLSGEYDETVFLEMVKTCLATSDELPEGMGIAKDQINLTLEEIYGSALNPESNYTFWAIPALYSEGDGDIPVGFYVLPGMFYTHELMPISVSLELMSTQLYDAEIKVEVKGTDMMYAGTAQKSDGLLAEIVAKINNGVLEPVTKVDYEGKASAFPNVAANESIEFMPSSDYVCWVVPVEEGKTEYTENDVFSVEFSTPIIQTGGSLTITAGESEVTRNSVDIPLSSTGAQMIYYTYLDNTGSRYQAWADDEIINDIIFASFESDVAGFLKNGFVKANTVNALVDRVKPNKAVYLFAVSVDADGKCGKVLKTTATTQKMTYNALTVTVNDVEVGARKATLNVTVSGGTPTELVYWVGKTSDHFWAIDMGGGYATAQEYMGLYPDDPEIVKCMNKNGTLVAGQDLMVNELTVGTEYVMVVVAKDASGLYSKVGMKRFTTVAADLGELVREGTQAWNDAKDKLKFEWIEELFETPDNSMMSAQYAFNFSAPTELTAFVMCGSNTYFEGMDLKTAEQQIVYVEEYCSRRYDNGYIPYDSNGEMLTEPSYYKEGEEKEGQLMNVYDYYVHGLPNLGFVTYFAHGSHGEGNCIHWEEGKDIYYERALERIAYHKTIECYLERAGMFGLAGTEAQDWAQDLLEAYLPYYENAKPIIYENTGAPLRLVNPYASGYDSDGYVIDRVIVVLKDKSGNYYAPMTIEVPDLF